MRSWLKKYIPNKKELFKENSFLGKFKHYLEKQKIWGLDYHSVAKGVAAGLFVSFIPLPIQTIIAAFLAILLRANILIAIAITWVSNPFTFAFFVYAVYLTGVWTLSLMGGKNLAPSENFKFENLHNFTLSLSSVTHFGKAFFIGLPIISISIALLGYLMVIVIWKICVYFRSSTKK